jgi:hypothetical protein
MDWRDRHLGICSPYIDHFPVEHLYLHATSQLKRRLAASGGCRYEGSASEKVALQNPDS